MHKTTSNSDLWPALQAVRTWLRDRLYMFLWRRVGKTELCKALAAYMFDTEDAMVSAISGRI